MLFRSLDKRSLYIMIAVMAGIAFLQFASEPGRLLSILLAAPGVLVAITFH